MKKKILIIIILFCLVNSCQKVSPNENNSFRGKGSSLIETEDNSNHFYELREIETKFDVKTGEKKCKNYGILKTSENEYYIYGLNLKIFLSHILMIPEKDIFYQKTEFNNYCFELNYKMKNELKIVENRDTIINKLLKNYNLSLLTDSITVEAYNLKVIDSIKLKKSITKNKIGEFDTKTSNFETEIKGISLRNFANFLNMNNHSNHFFSNTINTNSFYDFKIKPNLSIDYLNKNLKEKYGLILIKDSLKIKRVKIKTTANNGYN